MSAPSTSTPYRGSYTEIGASDDPHPRRSLRRFLIVSASIAIALVVMAVPSVFVSKKLAEFESENIFAMFREKPEVAIPAW
jgi:hypothetical protein